MIRLHIMAEGITEQRFVENLLLNHLIQYGVIADVCCFTTKQSHKSGQQFKGGISSYSKVKNNIQIRLRSDQNPDSRFTTMIDLYGIPSDFPAYPEATKQSNAQAKIVLLETAFTKDIADSRFIPYIQLHEFESLLFADPEKFKSEYVDFDRQIDELVNLSKIMEPEMINDNPNTAPSKRVLDAIPIYDKAYAGSRIAGLIGLENIRKRCPHFHNWLLKLEKLNEANS